MSLTTGRLAGTTTITDHSTWDTLVLAHPQASFLQSYAWGRFKQHFGWAPVRLCLPSRGGEPAAVAQVLFRRIPYSPYTLGYLPRGPLLAYEDDAALDAMECALDRVARHYRAVTVTWELPVREDAALTRRLLARGLRATRGIQTRSTNVVDLARPLEEIMARQKPKWRSNTRLAMRHGVQVRPASGGEDVSRWYALHQATGLRDGFIVRGEAYYRRLWQAQHATGDTVLLLAEHEGRLLAGIMVHRFGPEATYLYGASADEGRNLMPGHLLQWEAMQWARARGAIRYDLFGIADTDDPNEPLAGVTRFKAGFGGTVVRYAGAFDRVYHPALHRLVQRVRARSME